jgi:hypothetical protein
MASQPIGLTMLAGHRGFQVVKSHEEAGLPHGRDSALVGADAIGTTGASLPGRQYSVGK